MNLRKTAGLLAAFGLMVGLIGSGVGAVFTDQVTADEHISIGTFECLIVEPSDGTIAGDAKSVSYTAPTIMSSAPGSAPFQFTVEATGSIPVVLQVSVTPVNAPFSIIGEPFADQSVTYPGTHTYNTGIQWAELSSVNEGTSGTVTWTINCVEAPATQTVTSALMQYGPNGWAGWSCPAGTDIISASILDAPGYGNGLVMAGSPTLWQPGASVPGYTYPATPFGYTYGPGEEGAIAQNDNDGDDLYIVLVCTL